MLGTPNSKSTKDFNKSERLTNSAGSLRILSANRSTVIITKKSTSDKGYTNLKTFLRGPGNNSERVQSAAVNKSSSAENIILDTVQSQDTPIRPQTEHKSLHTPKKSSFTIQKISNLKFGEVPSKRASTEIMSATTRIMAEAYTATKAPFSRGWSQEPIDTPAKKEGEAKRIADKIHHLKESLLYSSKSKIGNEELFNSMKNSVTHQIMVLDKLHSRYLAADTAENFFLESVIEANTQISLLLKNIRKYIHGLHEERDYLAKSHRDAQSEISHFKLKKEEDQKKLLQTITTFEPKDSEIKIQYDLLVKQMEKKEMIWAVEKQKLVADIELLSKKIYEYETFNDVKKLKSEMGTMVEKFTTRIHDYDSVLEKKSVRVYKLELDLANERYARDQVTKDFRELEEKYNITAAENKKLLEFKETATEKLRMNRETFNMLNEDHLGKEIRAANAYQTIRDQKNKMKIYVAKIDNLISQFNSRKNVYSAELKKDSGLLENFKQIYGDRRGPSLCLDNGKATDKSKGDEYAVEKIKLEKYCLQRPSFYSLIQEDYEKLSSWDQAQLDIPDIDVVQMIRGIFDSKYNEYLYYQDTRAISHFADFTYSWLSSFHIDPVQLKVRTLGQDDGVNVKIRRIALFHSLVLNHLSQIWDVVIFKEFLEENYTNDEIFFFLHCRYLLFQGAQLDFVEGGVDLVHYIKTERALKLFDIVMTKVEPEQMKTFKNLMKQRSKYKFGNLIIDAGLVLKTLLDFYRVEKKWRFNAIQDEFLRLTDKVSVQGINMSFLTFKSFIDMQYPSTTELDKAKLFRDAWCYGNGKVDNESFYIAASESGYFIEIILRQEFKNLPPVSLSHTPNDELTTFKEYISTKYDSLLDLMIHCKKIIASFGIETLGHRSEQLEIFLNKKMLDDEAKIELFYNSFIELLGTFVKVRNLRLSLYGHSNVGKSRVYEQDVKALEKIIRSSILYSNDNRLLANEKMEKLRKFQMYTRLRKYKFLDLMKTLKQKIQEEKRIAEEKKLSELKLTTEDDHLSAPNNTARKISSAKKKSRNPSATSPRKSPKKKIV